MITLRHADGDLKKVVLSIYHKHTADFLQTYSGIESDTGLTLKRIKQVVSILKKLDYVDVTTGFDEDGLIRGRGFYIKRDKEGEVDMLDELFESAKEQS